MTPKAKLFLSLAAGTGLLMFMGSKKEAKASEPTEEETEEPLPPIAPELPIPGVQPPPVLVQPLPGEVVPPRKEVPEEPDEKDEPIFRVPVPLPPEENFPPVVPRPAPRPPEVRIPPPDVIAVPRPPIVQTPDEDEDGPPPVETPEQTTELAKDTADVLRVMLARESTADWKRKEPLLGVWQKKRGLKDDQKFGPGTALVMAEETGLLPVIRFWPKGAIKEAGAVEDYQQALLEEASEAEEPRRAQLMAAAEREQGQGFGRNPVPITPTISI